MSNRYARILAAGSAAVLAAALAAPTALAGATAKTWTIQPGGAVHAQSGKLVVKDATTGTVLACRSLAGFPLTARGSLKSGSGLPGSRAGSLSAASFGHCAGPAGPIFTLQAGGLPWHVNLSSYNAATGVVRGTISHLQIITGSGVGCTFVIDGTGASAHDGQVAFSYSDSTGQLTVLTTGGNLHIYDVTSGCLGLVHSGDPAALGVTYTVTPKQAITSP
jgi:hypothetical protein